MIDSDDETEINPETGMDTETKTKTETETEIDTETKTETGTGMETETKTETETETGIDSDSESDDELPQKKRKFIESDSESDDELPQKKRKIVNKLNLPDWLIQSINFHNDFELSDSIYYGIVFIFLKKDELDEMSLRHKKQLIKLLFKPNDVTYKNLLITLYDIGKNYSFLQKVMKNQFDFFIDSFHKIKSNRFPSIYRDEKKLNMNYLKLHIDDRRSTKPLQKNILDGMLYWLYNTYTVNENETYYFGNPEERVDLESESESESGSESESEFGYESESESEYEYQSESESEDELMTSQENQENDIDFVLGVSQNIKKLLKGKGKNVELYNKMTNIVSKYHIQNLSSNNKEAKKQIIDCIFDQDMDMVVEYAYAKIQQEL